MILANGEGQLVFLVIMAVIGVINWASQKLSAGNKKAPPNPSQPGGSAPPSRPANAESEEERMRRFLEALGLPAAESPAPSRPRAELRPVPPIVAPTSVQPAPRRQNRPTASPPPLQPQPRASRPAPGTRAGKNALPELAISSLPEFETISSRIAALPADFPGAREDADRPTGTTLGETLRAALASPQQLRSAFILAEVFGPPPGLRQP